MNARSALLKVIQSNPGISFPDARQRARIAFDDAFDALRELTSQHRVRILSGGSLFV